MILDTTINVDHLITLTAWAGIGILYIFNTRKKADAQGADAVRIMAELENFGHDFRQLADEVRAHALDDIMKFGEVRQDMAKTIAELRTDMQARANAIIDDMHENAVTMARDYVDKQSFDRAMSEVRRRSSGPRGR